MSWPFSSPENTAVFVDPRVLKGAWICMVVHDAEDGAWQFHAPDGPDVVIGQGALVGLREVTDLDPSILQLADLPEDWIAFRDTPTSPWFRKAKANL